jgi:hypothetical protein
MMSHFFHSFFSHIKPGEPAECVAIKGQGLVVVAVIVCRYGAGDDFNVFCILGEWICSSLT